MDNTTSLMDLPSEIISKIAQELNFNQLAVLRKVNCKLHAIALREMIRQSNQDCDPDDGVFSIEGILRRAKNEGNETALYILKTCRRFFVEIGNRYDSYELDPKIPHRIETFYWKTRSGLDWHNHLRGLRYHLNRLEPTVQTLCVRYTWTKECDCCSDDCEYCEDSFSFEECTCKPKPVVALKTLQLIGSIDCCCNESLILAWIVSDLLENLIILNNYEPDELPSLPSLRILRVNYALPSPLATIAPNLKLYILHSECNILLHQPAIRLLKRLESSDTECDKLVTLFDCAASIPSLKEDEIVKILRRYGRPWNTPVTDDEEEEEDNVHYKITCSELCWGQFFEMREATNVERARAGDGGNEYISHRTERTLRCAEGNYIVTTTRTILRYYWGAVGGNDYIEVVRDRVIKKKVKIKGQ